MQVSLHGRNVVNRLSHHPGQFLNAGETVKLERVESLRRVFGLCQAGLHLGLSLHFNIPELMPQSIQIACQFAKGTAKLPESGIKPGTGDHHFTSLIDQTVEKLRADPYGLTAHRPDRHHCRGTNGRKRCRCRCCCFLRNRFSLFRRDLINRRKRGFWQALLLIRAGTQSVKIFLDAIETGQ